MKSKVINYVRKIQGSRDRRSIIDRWILSTYNTYRGLKTKLRRVNTTSYSRAYLQSRNLKRNLKGKKFKFVTIDQASIWTMEWIKTFPCQYDLIVGIPRSGMFIASIIALKLGKGLTTPELFREGRFWHSSFMNEKLSFDQVKNVLLVDDAVDTGRAMSSAMEVIEPMSKGISITKASMIVREDSKPIVDLYHKVIAPPRVFEWNILHRKIASYWGHGILAVDMDGILCANCPRGVDNDELLYLEWLNSARPYLIPSFEIDAIVSNRLEKYRPDTEHWLKMHNVKYKKLYMWDIPDKSERKEGFARHKIEQLLQLKPDMYWESEWAQSQMIWSQTKIPTLCIDEMTLLC